jgi:UDP-glucose 4-epimerase
MKDYLFKCARTRLAIALQNLAEKLNGKKVLITGGAGFIGSNLADAIAGHVDQLTILDNMSNGSYSNLESLLDRHRDKVALLKGDVRNREECLEASRDKDIVFHLAAQINPAKAVDDPEYDFEVNARGTLNVLEAARKNKVKRLVFASTNIYGNPKSLPVDENHPIDLLSPYAAAKLAGEAYSIVYHNTHGLETVRLRFCNVYGPRQTTKSESGAIMLFAERLLNGEAPVIFGDGKQTRDFVYVSDVVDALVKSSIVPEAAGEAFNIGSGAETSINDLARIIMDLMTELTTKDFHVEPVHGTSRAADFRRARMDISKAQRILEYRPTTTLEAGLRKALAWRLSSASDKQRARTSKQDA